MTSAPDRHHTGRAAKLSLAPFRALRPSVNSGRLGSMLSPPYDVIDADLHARLLDNDPDNVVQVILPEPTEDGYAAAARRLESWVDSGRFRADERPALYVYEMSGPDGHTTRGLLGAVELRDPADGVILPHENTMAGPVADRLAVMSATGTDLEPIYLVYDGGGPASELVRTADDADPVATATTPDGFTHRLWAVTDKETLGQVRDDLAQRHALIADGHHRYATYRERQRLNHDTQGAGPWDRGLALLVDSSEYGPQVHPIHRFVHDLSMDDAIAALAGWAATADIDTGDTEPTQGIDGFAAVVTDGVRSVLITDPDGRLRNAARREDEPAALAELDVAVLHRGLIEKVWNLDDTVDTVGYAHSTAEAVDAARSAGGFAILLRATPVSAVAAVAAAGARMPRKSTLFTPKPASGLVMRRLVDQTDSA